MVIQTFPTRRDEILEYCDREKIISREQYYLNLFQPEYNILRIAGSFLGYKHPQNAKTRNWTSERKALHLQNCKKPDWIAKNLEQLKKMRSNPEFKAKNLEHLKALQANLEYRAKNSERLKKRWANPEVKAILLEQLKKILKFCIAIRNGKLTI